MNDGKHEAGKGKHDGKPVVEAAKPAGPVQAVAVAPAAANGAAPAKDGAKIILKNGEARVDYIKRRFNEGATRSQITKEINSPELSPDITKKVPYQVVFAATKALADARKAAAAPTTTPAA